MDLHDAPLVWVDLEMTGLDAERCVILELGMVLTGPDLVPLERYEAVIWQPEEALARMEPVVQRMHTDNGLLGRVRASEISVRAAEREAVALLARHLRPGRGVLAGNSIYTDRRFLAVHMPMLDRYLHYRMVDVSSIRVLTKAWFPGAPEQVRTPRDHTAMADLESALAQLAHYRDTFFKRPEDVPRMDPPVRDET
jgi:oligoribonuclease